MANGRKKRRWDFRRAMQGINKLWEDPDNTAYVFEIIEALPGRAQDKAFDRFLRSETGQRILVEKRSLLDTLNDRAYLASLPEGSLGREYLAFVEAENISADGLMQASIDGKTQEYDWGPERQLFGERLRDMHDLWHVVTGYQRDLRGEGALLAFSFAQVRTPGVGLIVLMAYKGSDREYKQFLREGWKFGRSAAWLPGADWEMLLTRPLGEVRSRLNIGELPDYEPEWSEAALAARGHAQAA